MAAHYQFVHRLDYSYCYGKKGEVILDIGIILKVAGVGILVSAASQILSKSGRDEQSMLVTIAGIVVVLIMLIGEIEKLFQLVCSVFGF